MTRNPLSLLALALFLLLGVGCCPITRLNISVDVDESFRTAYGNRQVTVDVVAVGPLEQSRWVSYPMTKYWEAGDTMRKSLPTISLTIDPSKKEPQVISTDNPIWTKWLDGANEKAPPRIYVLVQLPKIFDAAKDDRLGDADPRRQILPTGSCRWENKPPLVKLLINADRIITLTAPKPDKGAT